MLNLTHPQANTTVGGSTQAVSRWLLRRATVPRIGGSARPLERKKALEVVDFAVPSGVVIHTESFCLYLLSSHCREHFAGHLNTCWAHKDHEDAWENEQHEWENQLDGRLGSLLFGQLLSSDSHRLTLNT